MRFGAKASKIVRILRNPIEIGQTLSKILCMQRQTRLQNVVGQSEFSGLKNCQQTAQQMAVRFQRKHQTL